MTLQILLIRNVEPRFAVIASDRRQINVPDDMPNEMIVDDDVTKIAQMSRCVGAYGQGKACYHAGPLYVSRLLSSLQVDENDSAEIAAQKIHRLFNELGIDDQNRELKWEYKVTTVGFNESKGSFEIYNVTIPGEVKPYDYTGNEHSIFSHYDEAVLLSNNIFYGRTIQAQHFGYNELAKTNLSGKRHSTNNSQGLACERAEYTADVISETIETLKLKHGERETQTRFMLPRSAPVLAIGGKPDVAIIEPDKGGFRWHIKSGELQK